MIMLPGIARWPGSVDGRKPIQTVSRVLWGPGATPFSPTGGGVMTSTSLNDADNSIAAILAIPRTGEINRVGFNASGVTGNPPAYNVGLVTVDTSGNPTTTAYGGSASTTHDFTATGWVWVTLATPANGVAGDIVAVRVWPTATAPNASNYAAIRRSYTIPGDPRLPHFGAYTTAWTLGTGFGAAAMYTAGDVVLPAIASIGSGSYDVDSTPDEIGCLFSLPVNAMCVGMGGIHAAGVAADDFAVNLYASDGSTKLATVSVDTSQVNGLAAQSAVWYPCVALPLQAGLGYRLTYAPSTAADLQLAEFTVNEVASREWFPEGARWQRTERTDAGAWTETPTRLPMLFLVLSHISPGQGRGFWV